MNSTTTILEKTLISFAVALTLFLASCNDTTKPDPEPIKYDMTISHKKLSVNQITEISGKIKNYSYDLYVTDSKELDEILTPNKTITYRPKESGKIELTFYALDENNKLDIAKEIIEVTNADFFAGAWGDTKERIYKCEDGIAPSSGGLIGYWHKFRGFDDSVFGAGYRYYHFDEGIFTEGKTSSTMTASYTYPQQMLYFIDNWFIKIQDITEKYGAPTSNSAPSDLASWSDIDKINFIQTGDSNCGATFEDKRTAVTFSMTRGSGGSGTITFIYDTVYESKL